MEPGAVPPLSPRFPADVPSERLLASNLAALAACDGDLARRLAQVKPEPEGAGVLVRPAATGLPTVVAGRLHVHSAFDPTAEAAVQARRVPADAPRVMVLGFGAGHLLAALLQRPELRRLDVVPLHAGVLRAVAAAVDLKPLLCDPRLRFVAEEKPQLSPTFAVVPPLLQLADAPRAALCQAAAAALRAEAEAANQNRRTHA